MKLEHAFKIAKACGLSTVEDAILNIELHVLNIFDYSEIKNEMKELYEDLKLSGYKLSDNIDMKRPLNGFVETLLNTKT